MESKEAESENVKRLCKAVSPNDEPCDFPATVHCAKCGRWFCDAHAEDQEWHPCMLPSGDEGGEHRPSWINAWRAGHRSVRPECDKEGIPPRQY
jgi:hypothetical protein